jgi:hypothetical protein
MSVAQKLSKYIIVAAWRLKVDHLIPDKTFLSLYYRWQFDRKMHWRNPRTFNEKLQWLKVYNRKAEYSTLVDKYSVKQYIADKLGERFVVPVLGVWDRPEDIEWDKLPERFVVKCSHDCGGSVICRNKAELNIEEATKKLKQAFSQDYYIANGREWPYKNVVKRIFAEQFLVDKDGHLNDYKFFCFGGEPKYCSVISGREVKKVCIDFFDKDWNHQPFHQPGFYPFAETEIKKPECYDQMWEYARILAADKPFVRIDFYEVDGKVYFGEVTFFPTSGFGPFAPEEWDMTFGSWINLPPKRKEKK